MTTATIALEKLSSYLQSEYETRKKAKTGMTFHAAMFIEEGDHFDEAKLALFSYEPFRPGLRIHALVKRAGTVYHQNSSTEYMTVNEALAALVEAAGNRNVLLGTLVVDSEQSPVPVHHDWYINTKSAFSELFKSVDRSHEHGDPYALRRRLVKEQLECALKSGVVAWNARPEGERVMVDWENTNLDGLQLDGIDFTALDMSNSSFRKTSLQKANFNAATLVNARFQNAALNEATFNRAQVVSANFSGASLKGASLEKAGLTNCSFDNADLTKAKLTGADIRGVDFSTATLSKDSKFRKAIYDEKTKFPDGFEQHPLLVWLGAGPDPQKLKCKQNLLSDVKVSDFGEFLERLRKEFDQERVKKAIAMLSKETFQLFSEVEDDMLIGVVKSQTDKDLVYACQLRADGVFSCCTQNLNACGGLRGAMCKHLLVLTLGLARTDQIDTSKCLQWVLASRLEKKPKLDRERMTDVFLKYKGAEAGEIDWRPTETMPEDYYAF